MQRPHEARQARNTLSQEEQQHPDPLREADGEGETSRVREHDPYIPPKEDRNEGMPDKNDRNNELTPY